MPPQRSGGSTGCQSISEMSNIHRSQSPLQAFTPSSIMVSASMQGLAPRRLRSFDYRETSKPDRSCTGSYADTPNPSPDHSQPGRPAAGLYWISSIHTQGDLLPGTTMHVER